MKKLIIFLWILGFGSVSYSQVIQLQEAKVFYKPTAEVMYEEYNNGNLLVVLKERYAQQFQNNAVKFLIDNFDVQNFMNQNSNMNNDFYVLIRSQRGFLKANYNKNGELLQTSQRFRDILLPREIWQSVYGSHQGWTMTKNIYSAKGKGSSIDSEKYLVTMKKGKKQEKLKLSPNKTRVSVAGLE